MPSAEVSAAIIAGVIALLGYPVSNYFTHRSERQARAFTFKLDCYQNFLKSFFEYAARNTFEAQLAFTHAVNVMNLMASQDVLNAIGELVNNYNDPEGTVDNQWKIVNTIVRCMREDLARAGGTLPENYQFQIIVPDLEPGSEPQRPARRRRQ